MERSARDSFPVGLDCSRIALRSIRVTSYFSLSASGAMASISLVQMPPE
jgi:hypothetical protein